MNKLRRKTKTKNQTAAIIYLVQRKSLGKVIKVKQSQQNKIIDFESSCK